MGGLGFGGLGFRGLGIKGFRPGLEDFGFRSWCFLALKAQEFGLSGSGLHGSRVAGL